MSDNEKLASSLCVYEDFLWRSAQKKENLDNRLGAKEFHSWRFTYRPSEDMPSEEALNNWIFRWWFQLFFSRALMHEKHSNFKWNLFCSLCSLMPFLCRERKHLTAKHKTIIKLFAISREREKKFHSLRLNCVFYVLERVRCKRNCNMNSLMNLPTSNVECSEDKLLVMVETRLNYLIIPSIAFSRGTHSCTARDCSINDNWCYLRNATA
jgi:hypothetical protein